MINGDIYPTNKCGELEVIEYRGCNQVRVRFLDTGFITTATAGNIRKGNVKDKNLPILCGVGYLGEGKYSTRASGRPSTVYNVWRHMIRRCYDPATQRKHPTYVGCLVTEEWHSYQNFAKWYDDNNVMDGLELDKDIKVPGNKLYSPETCMLVTKQQNLEEMNTRIAKESIAKEA
ncbi:HNH endonuclease [Vibrio phage D249]|nr:hypothetical protein SIPHO036v1_140015 [Vibrio phage 70E38.1]QZI87952.1 hypothetical protein SIPHO041v1_p0041 [Vibrio phage 234P1]QZI88122.1 hypothetical protein SIPHO035v1_p0031 [Vibrio phage 234P7B]QZI88410.1 hypothetical protein SIPHO082v1_p0133 [Vibrio phage 294E48.1]QZI88490.1 hypothetical protein SIPHO037v1_p0049 [Vibrio phage 70E35.2]QZI88674.1 hypothetical protein SIPHO039v1_p0045 [Vibrio phage 70E35.5a]QZI88859.1 hypothetical protein SIPHO040v1_p0046 [Vibrio phage 70E35.6]QZI8916